MLALEHFRKLDGAVGVGRVGGNDVGGWAFGGGLQDGALGLEIVILQEMVRVLGEVGNCGQEGAFFVVVVIALRPVDDWVRRILPVPCAGIFFGGEDALFRVCAAVAEGFIEAADAVVHGGEEHEVAGAPGVEVAVGEDAGHVERLHLGHVVPAHFGPLLREDGIDPGVVGAVADGVVVEERHRFMQVVQHLRMPADVGVEDVASQVEGHAHGVAVVVMRDVMAPVEQMRPILAGVRLVPAVDVDHAVAAIDFNDRSDEHDHVLADVLDVWGVIDGEAVGQLHECCGRAGFRRVDGAGDVVDRKRLIDQRFGLGIVQTDLARVGELGKARVVFLVLIQQLGVGNGGGDHLAALFGVADGEDFDARTAGLKQAEVFVDIFSVGQHVWRSGYVAEHFDRRGHGLRGGQVIDQRRGEGRIGGVLVHQVGVALVDGLRGVAGVVGVQLLRLGGVEATGQGKGGERQGKFRKTHRHVPE